MADLRTADPRIELYRPVSILSPVRVRFIIESMKSLLVLAPAVVLSLVSVHAQALPDGPGKGVFSDICGSCHGLDIVTSQTGTHATWQDLVDDMRGRGATGSDDDFKAIVDYLAKNFPAAAGQAPAAAPATTPAAAPLPLRLPRVVSGRPGKEHF